MAERLDAPKHIADGLPSGFIVGGSDRNNDEVVTVPKDELAHQLYCSLAGK